ncbi:MAG: hypothetical protein ACHQ0J_11340 [Candidatus Dormibacterales bacterium]
MTTQVIEPELERIESLWTGGLSDAYRSYLKAVAGYDRAAQPKLALAAALVEVGVELQGLGRRAAPPPMLLMGDLCLARSSRLLASAAPQAVQVAFASAIESMSFAAASNGEARPVRELLLAALKAGR